MCTKPWINEIDSEIVSLLHEAGDVNAVSLEQCASLHDRIFLHGQLVCKVELTDKAIRSFDECLRLNENSVANLALGRIYFVQGQYEKAVKYFEKTALIHGDATDIKTLSTWLYVLRMLKDKSDVAQKLEKRIQDYTMMTANELGVSLDERNYAWDFNKNTWLKPFKKQFSNEFKLNKFTVLKNVIPKTCFELIAKQHDYLIRSKKYRYQQENNRFVMMDPPFATLTNQYLCMLIKRIIKSEVVPTYAFGIQYLPSGAIKPHTDRRQNELSMSMNLSITPETGKSALGAGEGKNAVSLNLKPNHALLYRGCEVVHYRDPVPDEHLVNQVIFGFKVPSSTNCYCG